MDSFLALEKMLLLRRTLLAAAALAVLAGAGAAQEISLAVDARDAPRRVFRVRETIPVTPGPLTLAYPKWIPGEHGAEGPVTDLVGLVIRANGQPVAWRRSPTEMWNFELVVPAGASALEVSFDYVASLTAYTTATARLAWINWWSVLLYPRGPDANATRFRATLTLPDGWKYATALAVEKAAGGTVSFAPVSLVTLIDSPLLAGVHFRTVDLSPGNAAGHFLHLAGDSAGAIEISEAEIARYRNLVAEAQALFGARHYRNYHFLLSLSNQIPSTGLEHHESSDNRAAERALRDETARQVLGTLLSHEYVHSWNGKYRSPAGLVSGVTADYQVPVDSGLLWAYEGLTEYYGEILGARSGLRTPELARENLALFVARMDRQSGRAWRPLVDTATAAQLLYYGRPEWASWRRGVDFYSEGALVWLDADVLIRRQSGGRKSLDDFVRAFHGGESGPPAVRTYTRADILAALNAVAPHDWDAFFRERVDAVAPKAPRLWVEEGGWKLVFTEKQPELVASSEEETETYDFWDSLGIMVQGDGADGAGLVVDVVPGMPAEAAGVGPGMKLHAVGGRRYSVGRLRDALRAASSPEGTQPIPLLVENAEIFSIVSVDYHGGERFPHLERETGKPDVLSEIAKPRRSASAAR